MVSPNSKKPEIHSLIAFPLQRKTCKQLQKHMRFISLGRFQKGLQSTQHGEDQAGVSA